mmetsp:Transcript_7539/g.8511  ORF Transcript_7539/g.8511 Transcript_7539/m.8511 type:complete len:130 (+) Transcript_7539:3-392(+)
MINIPIEEQEDSVKGGNEVYRPNDSIYPDGHSAQIEFQRGGTILLTTVYGPDTCTKYYLKDPKKCVIDVRCKFPASRRDDQNEKELQGHLKRTLQTCLKSKNYPGCLVSVVVDICSIHKQAAIPTLFSD